MLCCAFVSALSVYHRQLWHRTKNNTVVKLLLMLIYKCDLDKMGHSILLVNLPGVLAFAQGG